MTILEQLQHLLSLSGIFDAENPETLVYDELLCYANALGTVREMQEDTLKKRFLQSADADGAAVYAALLETDGYLSDPDAFKRDNLDRLAQTPGDWNRLDIERRLKASGLPVQLEEQFAEGTIDVRGIGDAPLAEWRGIIPIITNYMPAHLRIRFRLEDRDWNKLETYGYRFGELDGCELTFAQANF